MTTLLQGTPGLAHLTDAEGRIIPRLVAQHYRISTREVGSLSGICSHNLQRSDRMFRPETRQRLREMVTVMSRAESLAGGKRMHAYAWYRATPLPSFGHVTASQLVHDGHANAVMDYLNALSEGGHE